MPELHARAIDGIPEIQPGDDLAAQIEAAGGPFGEDEVVVVSHKVVSKAEGCLVELASVQPGTRAVEIASRQDRDPRHVQVILDQSTGILRDERDVLICRTQGRPVSEMFPVPGIPRSGRVRRNVISRLPQLRWKGVRRIRSHESPAALVTIGDGLTP